MTDRLYYDDSYATTFAARLVAASEFSGRPAVALDRTGFYPTGGGQPCDMGWLNGVPVVDVVDGGAMVWHVLAGPLDATDVRGEIDWPRRWDHMQNHSGQHILSQSFIEIGGALTVAWHLSGNSLTIDLNRTDLDDAALADAERLANQIVQRNLPITARVVAEEDLPALALRKQPDIDGALRIVEIGDFDRVACSGTHVAATAQVGLIKLLRTERRGQETRVHFVCGGRALADYERKHDLTRRLALRFACAEDELDRAVDRLHEQSNANYKALKEAQAALVEAEAQRLLAATPATGDGLRLLVAQYPGWQGEQVKQLALTLRSQPGLVIVLAGGAVPQVFVARSPDVSLDSGQVLRTLVAAFGGKGGGRGDYAQGALPDWPRASEALAQAASVVSGARSRASD
ncbi:MAG: alanyl-tRNA editing protein [Caldilineales bacterium]